MLRPCDIADDVRRVLSDAHTGKGSQPHYLTAYQILDRLQQRDQLLQEHGMPGKHAGVYRAAAGVVKDALLHHLRGEVDISYFDNVGTLFEIAGETVRAGYPVCGLYRLSRGMDVEA